LGRVLLQCYAGGGVTVQTCRAGKRIALLRAKSSKDGDAELGDFGDYTRHVSPAASDSIIPRALGGLFVFGLATR